ncbi:SGNH/GDSL hydrolase family protein [Pseudolysinimonas sp.]|uniref:SGNH/GDSL hydrolase family protein n=1 Tax=Pseudolysinimonas sp. TaxID=2680009 RepID=UPI003F7D703D
MRWMRFAALGDSITEGWCDPVMTDLAGDPAEPWFGWADRLAVLIDEHQNARRTAAGAQRRHLEFANLAVRGRCVRHVVEDQIPAAIAMRADLVSVMVGGNDLMSLRVDPDELASRLDAGIAALRASGADVLLATGFDPGMTPFRFLRTFRGRAATLSANLASIAHRRGCIPLDLWGIGDLRHLDSWSADRLHPSTRGHLVITKAAAAALGIPGSPELDAIPAPAPALPTVVWLREHALPWVARRVRGVSSGDGRGPKSPEPREVGTIGAPLHADAASGRASEVRQ